MAPGSTTRSTDEWLMSRSCHSAWSSMPASAKPRSRRASPARRSDRIGLRLWGIALEPFWPARKGSCSSAISVCWRLRTSVAKRSIGPAGHRDGVEEGRVTVALDDLGAHRVGREAECRQRRRLHLRPQLGVRAHGSRDLARGQVIGRAAESRPVAIELEGPRRELETEGDGLRVDRMGAAHLERPGMLPGTRRRASRWRRPGRR